MEFLNGESSETLSGPKLVQAVTALTELPEEFAREELKRVLEHSGQSSDDLTLDQLRAAMLVYLESMQDSLSFDENT